MGKDIQYWRLPALAEDSMIAAEGSGLPLRSVEDRYLDLDEVKDPEEA